jgi:hypothetical protein
MNESNEVNIRKPAPRASYPGELTLHNTKINCFILYPERDDAKRLLSGRGVTNTLGLSGRGTGISRFLESKRISAHMSEWLVDALKNPIEFCVGNEKFPSALGYEARLLPELCFAIMDANDEKPLPPNQQKLVAQAKIVSRAFAVVGIEALVDEATGYEKVRKEKALQEILARYISPELLKWQRMFEGDFYEHLYRLRGWEFNPSTTKRTPLIGKLTIDLIYDRMAPGVSEVLLGITPRNEKGKLKHKLHQHLTVEQGKIALEKHLYAVTRLMHASSNWTQFKRMLERTLPKNTSHLEC